MIWIIGYLLISVLIGVALGHLIYIGGVNDGDN